MNELEVTTYQEHSDRFRKAWTIGRKQAEIAHIALNDMIRSLRKEHPDWSINKITQKIADDHNDLEGFSSRQIQRELDNENRELVQNKGSPDVKPKTPNKPPEQSYTPSEDTIKLNEQMEKAQNAPVTKVIEKGEPDYEAEYRKDQGTIGSLDKAEPFRVALIEKDLRPARDLVMRELMKLKGQGWSVIELTPRYIS